MYRLMSVQREGIPCITDMCTGTIDEATLHKASAARTAGLLSSGPA